MSREHRARMSSLIEMDHDDNKGDSAGFRGHGNQRPGRERLLHRGDHWPPIPGPCRPSNGAVVVVGDVRCGAQDRSGFISNFGGLQAGSAGVAAPWARSPAPCNCWMPESGCMSTILGNALGRSSSLSSNSSRCIWFTNPCVSRRKASTNSKLSSLILCMS